jgi:hypothetical protein
MLLSEMRHISISFVHKVSIFFLFNRYLTNRIYSDPICYSDFCTRIGDAEG